MDIQAVLLKAWESLLRTLFATVFIACLIVIALVLGAGGAAYLIHKRFIIAEPASIHFLLRMACKCEPAICGRPETYKSLGLSDIQKNVLKEDINECAGAQASNSNNHPRL